ncbi:hypothetical protein BK133_08665 [Paenibacillus sp. FSL H8-0548]|uniref:AraC family transcriptional regulator n=1 Tax=Paenibacillus sp. FSL H8-0548 TaxID=1920422 RepID=UPI00096C469F|nr:AraC family transcriptional regulator [Paenibacillus sp. FSL H8-0548]OMF36708.1 hypothetical protein BK133_08665 [Paenibacillus sp. FSL H8-0548]
MDATNIQMLSPYVRVAMDHWLQSGTVIAERMLWDYELLYVKQGALKVELEHTVMEAGAGHVLLFKPRQRHSIKVIGDSPVAQPHVHFDLIELPDSADVPVSFKLAKDMNAEEMGWFREDLLSGPDLELPVRIQLRSIQPFEEQLFRIIREYEIRLPFYQLRLKGLMLELLVCLLRDSYWPNQMGEISGADQLVAIQHYMNAHAGRELTLNELAGQFHMNKHHLIHLFKSAYRITPIQYHRQMRMERARNLLEFTQLTIQEIADSLGYPSIHAFSRAFKNKEGRSPSSYRAAAIQ